MVIFHCYVSLPEVRVFFIIEDFLIDFFLEMSSENPPENVGIFPVPPNVRYGTDVYFFGWGAGEVTVYGATCSALTKFGQNLSSMICRIYFARKQLELPTDLENKMNDKGNRLKSKQPVAARCSCFWKWVFKC